MSTTPKELKELIRYVNNVYKSNFYLKEDWDNLKFDLRTKVKTNLNNEVDLFLVGNTCEDGYNFLQGFMYGVENKVSLIKGS